MEPTQLLCAAQWAAQSVGPAPVGAQRRARRAVKAAGELARDPSGALPKQERTWHERQAVDRGLDEPAVRCAALRQPHGPPTRVDAQAQAVVRLVQETTELRLSWTCPRTPGGLVVAQSAMAKDEGACASRCGRLFQRPQGCGAGWGTRPVSVFLRRPTSRAMSDER